MFFGLPDVLWCGMLGCEYEACRKVRVGSVPQGREFKVKSPRSQCRWSHLFGTARILKRSRGGSFTDCTVG
jgi:hypothetical protein